MDNIIIPQKKVRRILSKSDLELLSGAKQYYEDVVKNSNELLERTKAECANLKSQLEIEFEDKLAHFSQGLREENIAQLTMILESIEKDIYSIVYKILNKLSALSPDTTNLTRLIQNELSKFLNINDLKISVNHSNVDLLRQELGQFNITYQIDDSLNNNQIKLNDSVSIIHVDINKVKNSIIHILNK